ncbi:MAG TPA: hypothetical protein EYH06_08510 [Chromatiales bacterium]|nr:hypothetical protein [Thiotrichales bacterium]HIP68617.1 hypothetical protein [Chromatiales bacterium]
MTRTLNWIPIQRFLIAGKLLVLTFVILSVWGCAANVAFVSERDGHGQIYKMSKTGNNQTNVSNTSDTDHFPDISPAGDRIVFSSLRGPGENIFIMGLNGQNVQQVTSGTLQRTQPRWAQNDLIAFAYPAYRQNTKIWTIKPDGTDLNQVTTPGPNESDGSGHDFYQGGNRIVFSRFDRTTQKRDLFHIGSDGSGLQQLTNTAGISEVLPVVSHDGKLLAYRAFFHGQSKETIRVLNIADWNQTHEISLPSPADKNISGIDFSKDDQRLYVSIESADVPGSSLNIKQEIFSIKLDGTDMVRLTNNTVSDTWPASIAPTHHEVVSARIPVLFVHGHSGGAVPAWQQPGTAGTTSFDAALDANPNLPVDPFYLELPVHGASHPENFDRSIAADATDILAAIEGGPDSAGVQQTGILNMPAYQNSKVAIVGYSQGGISSRYYLKNLMGSRRNGAITVSEFVALATPNHAVGDSLTCGNASQPDRSSRELCGGRTANLGSQFAPCGACSPLPPSFSTNTSDDDSFIEDLNGHSFGENCNEATIANPEQEAPRSRPTIHDGVLYVNLYAANNEDLIVGGHTQSLDCYGRRLARNHAPDAINFEITGVPSLVHANFPHHWPTICYTLKSIAEHQAPANQTAACQGLTPP